MGAVLGGEISEKVNSLLVGKSSIKLLEAGCGSASYFNFAPAVKYVGIDNSQEQLDRNEVIQEKCLATSRPTHCPKKRLMSWSAGM
jgi:hypothetical protein